MTTVRRPGKVIAPRGQRQVEKITSGEKGKTVTAICAMNAAACYIHPTLILSRVNMNDRLLRGAPPHTLGLTSKSGWVDSNLFKQWFDHFIRFAKPTAKQPHLLLLDGHVSHKSLPLIESARQNDVILVSFPPHTSHALQPLDCVFYCPLMN